MRLSFTLPDEFSRLEADNVASMLVYLHPAIDEVAVDHAARTIRLEFQGEVDADRVGSGVRALIERARVARKPPEPCLRFDRRGVEVPCGEDVLPALLRAGALRRQAAGVYSLHGFLARMHERLDARIRGFAAGLGAEEAVFPVSLPVDAADVCGYVSHHPHLVTFLCAPRNDLESIAGIARAARLADGTALLGQLAPPKLAFRPAACLHCYPLYREQVLVAGKPVAVTTAGRIFRNESVAARGLERMNEFTMREIVFIGSGADVATRIETCLVWMEALIDRLGLRGCIESAYDPFFIDRTEALQFYQLSRQSKWELKLALPGTGRLMAAASANQHGEHFSKAFNIRLEDGSFAASGCVGFGFERILFGVVAQHGPEPGRWSPALRDWFEV